MVFIRSPLPGLWFVFIFDKSGFMLGRMCPFVVSCPAFKVRWAPGQPCKRLRNGKFLV